MMCSLLAVVIELLRLPSLAYYVSTAGLHTAGLLGEQRFQCRVITLQMPSIGFD